MQIGRNLENSRTTSHMTEKAPTTKLRHIGNPKLSRRKSVFEISHERKPMI